MVNNIEKDKNQNKKPKPTKMNVSLNTNVISGNHDVEKYNKEESNIKNQKKTKDKVKDKENNIAFIVVERNGDLKEHEIKENTICAEELCRKCKFKKTDGFIKRTEWEYFSKSSKSISSASASDNKIIIELWAKDDGFANYENKYEFPPPVDNELFFGACALIARDNKNNYTNLTKETWNKIYEYLFGGFESLVVNEDSDEEEEDELDAIPSNKKTRDGYLKDGFVVDGGVAGESEGEIEGPDDDSETDTDNDDDSVSSDDASENGDGDGDGDDGEIGAYSNKKNKNALHMNKINVKNVANIKTYGSKNIIKDDDENAGWNTDESSELSEEEYSYS